MTERGGDQYTSSDSHFEGGSNEYGAPGWNLLLSVCGRVS